ncbi:MAG: LysM peptidoglycan-binding domain-containing protein [Candidatus Nomurabacteria bacterium]|nr:LysM peptidoglycan-binding domain-containing protein [Candidatus Nomurabacteria bacterium]
MKSKLAARRAGKKRSRAKTITSLSVYVGILIVVGAVVASGYRSPVASQLTDSKTVAVAAATKTDSDQAATAAAAIGQVEAADLASDVAQTADLSVANNVNEKSISLNIKNNLAQTDDSTLTNTAAQTVTSSPTAAAPLTTYVSVQGDTAGSIAAKFGISAQTVRWANGLTSDSVAAGQTLTIPSVDGVVYTTQPGDTFASIAAKYGSTADAIQTFNDLELSGLKPGIKIVIPSGNLPANEQPGYVAPKKSGYYGYYGDVTAMAGNRYSYGYCTWYVYNMRAAAGRPVGSFWGNASSWAAAARQAGYLVNRTPEVGAVMQNGGGWGGAGHVAYVTAINGDGSITISEMNYAGWDRVDSRIVTNPGDYNFIH